MQHNPEHATGTRHFVTCLEFYSYRLAVRSSFSPIFHSGKLFQQYVVDSYLRIESGRLNYIRQNQSDLRVDSYAGLMDHIHSQAENQGRQIGNVVILPSSSQVLQEPCNSITRMPWPW
jgi:hypothetical protein